MAPGLADLLHLALGLVGVFEHEIGIQRVLNLLPEFQNGQLQQADRLLQLRRHGQMVTETELDRGLHEEIN